MGLKEELLRGIYAYGQRNTQRETKSQQNSTRPPKRTLAGRAFLTGDSLTRLCLVSCPAVRTRAGFEKPSAIQQRAIIPILKGRDVIAQSQSGTGQTHNTSAQAQEKEEA